MGQSQTCGLWAVSCKSVLLGGGGLPCLRQVGESQAAKQLMRKSSCALPRGFAVVAERQGEGSGWLDLAQPHFGVRAASHPGVLLELQRAGTHACSTPVQSTLNRPVNLINNGKPWWLATAAALFVWGAIAELLWHIQPLTRLLPASFLLRFPPWPCRGVSSAGSAVSS